MDINLVWLQNFINRMLQSKNLELVDDITDEQIINDPYFNQINLKYSIFVIKTLNNPGWGIDINISSSEDKALDLKNIFFIKRDFQQIDNKFYNMFYLRTDSSKYINAFSSFSCLPVLFESLKCFIEDKVTMKVKTFKDVDEIKNKIQKKNTLLVWLDNFLSDSCEWNEYGEYYYKGTNLCLIYTKSGWLMSIYFEDDLLYEDKDFIEQTIIEVGGVVKCYKKGKHFIIRAHTYGLITGLKIFREWADTIKKNMGN